MASRVNEKRTNFKGKRVSIGVDVHKRTWHITCLADGEKVKAVTLTEPSSERFMGIVSKFRGNDVRVAYEAGPCGFQLYDDLTAEGIECIVVPPSLIPVQSGNRVKTDKRDSLKLADMLEGRKIPRTWVLTPEERADRQLLRTRRQVVNHRSSVMRQIKAMLLFHGIAIPLTDNQQRWSVKFKRWLREADLGNESLNGAVRSLMRIVDGHDEEVKELTRQACLLSKTEKYAERVKIIRSAPGIGLVSAMEILTELQDFGRFKTAAEIGAFLGLSPSQHSSGDNVRMGHITHCGNKRVRTALVEAAWTLSRKDPAMERKYERIKEKRGAKRAITAVARTLAIRIRRMVKDMVPYEIGLEGPV